MLCTGLKTHETTHSVKAKEEVLSKAQMLGGHGQVHLFKSSLLCKSATM